MLQYGGRFVLPALVLPGFTPGTTPCSVAYTATPKRWPGNIFCRSAWTRRSVTTTTSSAATSWIMDCSRPSSIRSIRLFDANSLQPSLGRAGVRKRTYLGRPRRTRLRRRSATTSLNSRRQTAAATFNYAQAFNEDSAIYNFTSPNAAAASFPQGRNITQYQFIDDFSWTHGNHTFKFGENFRRYDVSDHNFFYNSPRSFTGAIRANDLAAVCRWRGLPVPQEPTIRPATYQ